jgi:hypothetical protein
VKTNLLLLAVMFPCSAFAADRPLPRPEPKPAVDVTQDTRNRVQIALLLDTSSSMDGLINQARTQLWRTVNTFTEARRHGEPPVVEVALYEYGNNGLHAGNHWIRQVQPLTRDLDSLSKSLFELTTNGGEEYCGAVIQRALSDLAWDHSKDTYKVIFIAGNEPFTQGPVDARQACKDALAKGVLVNTIHCGNRDKGMSGYWHDGAVLAEGTYLVIDQDRSVVHVAAPQDGEITALSGELNKTYLGYGKHWKTAAENQAVADADAAANKQQGADVSRAATKAGSNYYNGHWDLVDAWKAKKIDLEKTAAADLPPEMQALKPEEREAYVQKAAATRAEIQKKILELNKAREAHVAKEQEKAASLGEKTLDQAMVEAARAQVSAFGYTFPQ